MDKMREEFEKEAKENGYDIAKDERDGLYKSDATDNSWLFWRKSRAALVVELPSHVNDMDSAPMLYDSIVEQLNALGIRYG